MDNIFITLGIGLIIVGIAYKYGLLDWFGNLPLDFKSEGENFSFYAPIGSMLLISLVLSLLMRFFGR
jgi:hypothetical protein